MSNNDWPQLYEILVNDRNYFTNKAWETIKFFTTIYTAILSITIGLVINFYVEIKTDNYIAIFIVFLPISAMIISEIGRRNFRRENARTYETIATLIKVEKLLGFHEEIEEKDRFLKKDKYVLPNYFIEINEKVKSHDTKYFIDWMIDREAKLGFGKFYSIFNYIFYFYIVIAIILVLLLVLIICSPPDLQ